MSSHAISRPAAGEAEALLGDELRTADAALADVGPVLSRLLAMPDPALFSDRILAQSRAQIEDLARQLIGPDKASQAVALAERLLSEPRLLGHAHATALEAGLTERLAVRLGLDPVTPPLFQASIASSDPDTSGTAMAALAAQARFGQTHRRGELPLRELPKELVAVVLHHRPADRPVDGGTSRLAVLDRLARLVGVDALDLAQAGVALFASALSIGAEIDRDTVIRATTVGQSPRLTLALIAAGAPADLVERVVFALHPDAALPDGFAELSAERAAALLATG